MLMSTAGTMEISWRMFPFAIIMVIISQQMWYTLSMQVGVNYGFNGYNLPTQTDAISLIKNKGIPMVRIFEPKIEVLEALRGSQISLCLGTRNEDLPNLASSQQAATEWVNKNVDPYTNDVAFKFIAVGNEAIPGTYAQYVLPAMQNMYASLNDASLTEISVTTVVSSAVLGTSYPPSQGAFSEQGMIGIVNFLHSNTAPLMVNVYPYIALAATPDKIRLDYALFQTKDAIVTDGALVYSNLFDAMFDAFAAAVSKVVGNNDMELVVSETGWPSAGGQYATVENAQTYNTNFKIRATQGTPRYGRPFDAFIFALFNENQKQPTGVEQNFGNFYPNMQPVYPLW